MLELARPRGLVPDRLVLETATPVLERPVAVWDEGPGAAAEPLARETVLRLPAPEVLEDLEVELAPPRGDRLRLVVVDGDSPPLEELRVLAVPAGVAEAAPLEENPAYRARARWLSAPGVQKLLLWGALVIAVAGLGILTLALARREGTK